MHNGAELSLVLSFAREARKTESQKTKGITLPKAKKSTT
jgi:hypothetical protein